MCLFQEFIDMYGMDMFEIISSFETAFLLNSNKDKLMKKCEDIAKIYPKYSKESIMLSIVWHVLRKQLKIKGNRLEHQPDYGIIYNHYLLVGIYSIIVKNKMNEENIRMKSKQWIIDEMDNYSRMII